MTEELRSENQLSGIDPAARFIGTPVSELRVMLSDLEEERYINLSKIEQLQNQTVRMEKTITELRSTVDSLHESLDMYEKAIRTRDDELIRDPIENMSQQFKTKEIIDSLENEE